MTALKMNRLREQKLIDLNRDLKKYFERNVQLSQKRKNEALSYWEPIVDWIINYVKRSDDRFASLRRFGSGSYYERAKVREPNEFDLMLIFEGLTATSMGNFSRGPVMTVQTPLGFTRFCVSENTMKSWWRDSCADAYGWLYASRVKAVFARLIRDAISTMGWESFITVKSHGPAVTLEIKNRNNGTEYAVDLTLAIKYIDWPNEAQEWRMRCRRGWPNQDLVREICKDGCYLVAKQPKGLNIPESEKGVFWRLSFSAAEKKLFIHGGHGEASSCRKQVLRIMKALKEDMNWDQLTSYHLKTIMLYECEAHPNPNQWSSDQLSRRLIDFLRRLEGYLEDENCPHYFIKDINLFEFVSRPKCCELASKVRQFIERLFEERYLT